MQKQIKQGIGGDNPIQKFQDRHFPAAVPHDYLDIAAKMIHAEDGGGDYYDFISKENVDWIIIGEATGRDQCAGLLKVIVRTAIHAILEINPDITPPELLRLVNKVIAQNCTGPDEHRYMTITVLKSRDSRNFSYSGLHLPLMIYRSNSNEIELIENEGSWLGIQADIAELNKIDTLIMERGDCLLLYTGGITDARSKKNRDDLFGTIQLAAVLKENAYNSAGQIVHSVLNNLDRYIFTDDITLGVIKKK